MENIKTTATIEKWETDATQCALCKAHGADYVIDLTIYTTPYKITYPKYLCKNCIKALYEGFKDFEKKNKKDKKNTEKN